MEENDKELLKSLLHARPHTSTQGKQIVALYRKYVNPGLTDGCSKCGGSLHNYLERLKWLLPNETTSK